MTMLAIASLIVAGKYEATQRQRDVMTSGWLHGCGVSLQQLDAMVKQFQDQLRQQAGR